MAEADSASQHRDDVTRRCDCRIVLGAGTIVGFSFRATQ